MTPRRAVVIRDENHDRYIHLLLTGATEETPNIENIHYYTWHRDDGPAVIYDSGEYHYYHEDELHREDGPACFSILNRGKKRLHRHLWYIHGKLHREDGPASTVTDPVTKEVFSKVWFSKNEYHNLYGPAVINTRTLDGVSELHIGWYRDGIDFTKEMEDFCINSGIDPLNLEEADKTLIRIKMESLNGN